MDTKKFLELFHGKELINFRVINTNTGKAVNLNGLYNQNLVSQLSSFNEQGWDTYFMVNGGGTHQTQINKINAVFIDFDCGRDENKNYFPLERTKQFKEEKLKGVSAFALKPSIIVETRNGLHVYWLVHDKATVEEYIECQLRLIQYFGSDKAVKTPERIMRLPGYYWAKKGHDTFFCDVIDYSGLRYNIKDILGHLPEYTDKSELEKLKLATQRTSKAIAPKNYKDSNIDLIKRFDVKSLQAKLNICIEGKGVTREISSIFNSLVPTKTPSTVFNTRDELFDFIYKINLIQFLGLNSIYFPCLFHKDKSSSASIFIDGESQHYLYKCHSSNCKFDAGNILTVIERLTGCTTAKAVNFIKELYDLELAETDWQIEQRQILQTNKDYLLSGKMIDEFPELYKRISRYLPELVQLHDIALDNVYDESLSNDNKAIFFCSFEYIEKSMNKRNKGKLNERINLFVFLELLNKLSSEQLPEKMLIRAKHEAAKKEHKYLKSHYTIPSYSYGVLSKANDMAKLAKERNLTMKGWSRELLIRTFDEAVADRVFPQLKGKKISEVSEEFVKRLEQVLYDLLEEKQYATENQCLDRIEGNRERNQTMLKRVLQETLDKYDLIRIRCNKELKEKYNVEANGYPYLIIKAEEWRLKVREIEVNRARHVDLVAFCNYKGLALKALNDGNHEVVEIPGLIIEDSNYNLLEPSLMGNSIDFCMRFLKMDFLQAISELLTFNSMGTT